MKKNLALESLTLNNLLLCFVVQLGVAFGLAGLLWPEKFMPLFEILMFPWAASCRAIRATESPPSDSHSCFSSRASLAIADRDRGRCWRSRAPFRQSRNC